MFRLPVPLTALAVLIAILSACSDKAPTDTVESLLANPERLKALRAQCKADHAQVGDATCNAVSEATRQRFMGAGTPYTPAPAKD
jgi:conjugal transfer/entry exclusion protein